MRSVLVGVAGLVLMSVSLMAAGADFHSSAGYLGVSIRDVNPKDVESLKLPAESGVYIVGVEDESPAKEAGLQEGDVVLEYATARVSSARQFQRVVSETPPGREVQMNVWRAGRKVGLSAKIGKGSDYTWFGRVPEIRIEKEIIPELHPGEHRFHLDKHDFRFAGRKPLLGVQVVPLTEQMAEFLGISGKKGALILEVLPSTPAEEAGFQAGDVIFSVNGHEVDGPADLIQHFADGKNDIEFARNKEISTVSVSLGDKEHKTEGALEL